LYDCCYPEISVLNDMAYKRTKKGIFIPSDNGLIIRY
jgi:hypothetical protein